MGWCRWYKPSDWRSSVLCDWYENSDFDVGWCYGYEASCRCWCEVKERTGVGGVCDRLGDPDMMALASGMMPWRAGIMAGWTGIEAALAPDLKFRSVLV